MEHNQILEIENEIIKYMNNLHSTNEWIELMNDINIITNMIYNGIYDFNIINNIRQKYIDEIYNLISNTNSTHNNSYTRTISRNQELLNLRYTLIMVGIYRRANEEYKKIIKNKINSDNQNKIEFLEFILNNLKDNKKYNN